MVGGAAFRYDHDTSLTRVSHVCRCLGGAGEANFLGGVAKLKGVADFDVAKAKERFFEIYINEVGLWDSDSIRWIVAGSNRIRL